MTILKRSVHYFLAVGVATSALLTMSAQSAHAQTSGGLVGSALSVSPAIIEKVVIPGESMQLTVNVRNVTNSPLPISTLVRPFTVQSEELEKTNNSRLDASEWFTFDEPQFILQPLEERKATGLIRPPLGVDPGGHYATIFFEPLIADDEAHPTMAKVGSRVGVLAFMTVQGSIVEKATLSSPLNIPKLVHPGPVEIRFSITNDSNIHIMPKGTVDVYNSASKKVASIPLPGGMILPDATKQYTIPWTTRDLLGNYEARLSLEYGSQHLKLQQSRVSFWIMPWLEILAGYIVLWLAWLFIFKTHPRWRKVWQVLRMNSGQK